jgi:flavorubredoxin
MTGYVLSVGRPKVILKGWSKMKPREIRPGVYWVGAIDWDRRLFDALIPLPDGTSYNSYLLKGSEKTALIDTVDPTMQEVLLNHLGELGVENIDYVVANHAEQDHTGAIPLVLEKYPGAKVVVTPRCKDMLIDLLMIPEERFIAVSDKETILLGGKTLEFIHAPWVHWPETMLTYLREDKILFPCDLFGSHLATTDLYVTDEGQVYEAAKRYYAEIMMPFRTTIQKNLEKIKEMHGSTYKMVEYFVEALAQRGVTVKQFDLTATDIGKLAMALVDAATVVIGTPTVLAGPHPNVVNAVFLANALRPKLKFVSIIGSYGWGGRAVEQLAAMIPNLKVEILEPVLCKGFPRETDFKVLDDLAETIAEKHREHSFT